MGRPRCNVKPKAHTLQCERPMAGAAALQSSPQQVAIQHLWWDHHGRQRRVARQARPLAQLWGRPGRRPYRPHQAGKAAIRSKWDRLALRSSQRRKTGPHRAQSSVRPGRGGSQSSTPAL